MRTASRIFLCAAASLACAFHGNAVGLTPSGNTKTLVAYFSATGNTRAVATSIADITGADSYEIEPSRPYAADPYEDSQLIQDEAYNDMRPEVANLPSPDIIAAYDTIYVGSPLWWRQPAMVVCTFLESYDLAGKVIVPFITYGGRTYLNEGMQKLFKCTPNSVHVPSELPEDLDPDNIPEPQNDDDGIDVPNNPSQVESWLERMGLWPHLQESAIGAVAADLRDFTVRNTDGGISVSLDRAADISIYDLDGRAALYSKAGNSLSGFLDKGIYIVNVRSEGLVASRKVTVN